MEKWALITGASSGIGRELAKLYAYRGYDLVLVARRDDRLHDLAAKTGVKTHIIKADLSDKNACKSVFDFVQKNELNVQLLINNAGFGATGKFEQTDLDRLTKMIDVNCTAVMTLTHLFLQDFKYRDSGAILNVASSAGLMPGGPNMAVYYATKAFVVSLTNSIYEELKASGSKVKIAALCPGPVNTEFSETAGVKFAMKGISADYCAKCAARGLDRGDRIIVPEESISAGRFLTKIVPENLSLKALGLLQARKNGSLF